MSEDGRLTLFQTWLNKIDAFAAEIDGDDAKDISGNGGLDTREHRLFERAGDLLKIGGEILVASIPEKVLRIAIDDVEEPISIEDRLLLAMFRLDLVRPIIDNPSSHTAMTRFFEELHTHWYGGETELFGQSPIKGHGNREPWKIAFYRMEALAYYQAGRERGLNAAQLQLKLHEAFGAYYDTIRKWRTYAIRVIGPELFERDLEDKLVRWGRSLETDEADEIIMSVGKQYQYLWRKSRK